MLLTVFGSDCAMSEAVFTLGALASDLAFSASFAIGRELLDAANDANMSEEELIGSVLVVTVVLTALPSTVLHAVKELRDSTGWGGETVDEMPRGLSQFASLLIDISRRIAVSLAVQLLSANVQSRQNDRAVRVMSLLTVVIFFLFLEATSEIAKRK